MAKTKETTAEEKLRALYDLQIIDRRIDEIRSLRGELPLEVRDLEDDIAGMQTRFDKMGREIKELEAEKQTITPTTPKTAKQAKANILNNVNKKKKK